MPRRVHIKIEDCKGEKRDLFDDEVDELYSILAQHVGRLDALACDHLSHVQPNFKDSSLRLAMKAIAERDAANALIEKIFVAKVNVSAELRPFVEAQLWNDSTRVVRANKVTMVAFFEAMVRDGEMERVVEGDEIRYQIRIREPH